jgi:hypothetical protein
VPCRQAWGSPQIADFAGLLEDGGQACATGELVAVRKAATAADPLRRARDLAAGRWRHPRLLM